jgi:hypothetical protein
MKQLEWLDIYRGKWRLITGIPQDPVRQWTDMLTALSDLAGEGWSISGPYLKEGGAKRELCGYAPKRLIR